MRIRAFLKATLDDFMVLYNTTATQAHLPPDLIDIDLNELINHDFGDLCDLMALIGDVDKVGSCQNIIVHMGWIIV